jgi:hypothetical protein
VLGAVACLLLFWFVLSRPRAKSFIALSFPLRDGWYYVAHGGSWRLVNNHTFVESQRYALDIVRLKALGFRARGVYPSELRACAIFHDAVYGPCEGVVTAVVTIFQTLHLAKWTRNTLQGTTSSSDRPAQIPLFGLAHLAHGSICVRPGDIVTVGQPLAQVGNSGNTTEPHLHIHAKCGGKPDSMLDGEGIAIRFRGKWLIGNSVVRAAPARVESHS